FIEIYFFSGFRDGLCSVQDITGYGGVSGMILFNDIASEMLINLDDSGFSVNQKTAIFPAKYVDLFILFRQIAHNRFEKIVKRNHAYDTTVFVDHDSHVLLLGFEDIQNFKGWGMLRNNDRLTNNFQNIKIVAPEISQ